MEKKYRDKLINHELEILDEIDRICKLHDLTYFLTAGTLLGAVRHGGVIPWDDDIDISMPREDYEKFINISQKSLNSKFYMDEEHCNKKYARLFGKVRYKNTSFIEKGYRKDIPWEIWIDIFPLDNINNNRIVEAEKIKKRVKTIETLLVFKYQLNFSSCQNLKEKLKFIVSQILPGSILRKMRMNLLLKYNNDSECFINYGSQYSVQKQIHEKSMYYPVKSIKFEDREYAAPNNIEYVLTKIYGNNYMELPPIEKRKSHNPLKIKFIDGEEVVFDE